MNAVTAIKPFDPLAAYHRERAYSRRLETTLSRALMLLEMECSRRELRGEDVSAIQEFASDARKGFGL